jgi:anti-sigma-K factor RskA
MTEHREEHLELCAAYAVGNIDPADRQRLTEHLGQGCDDCEAALADYGAAALLLAASAPMATPSPGLRERVMAAAGAEDRMAAVADDAVPPAAMPVPPRAAAATETPPPHAPRPVTAPLAPAPPRPASSPRRSLALPRSRSLSLSISPGGWVAVAAGLGVIVLILLITIINLAGALGAARREVNSNLDALGAINTRLEDTRRWSDVMSAPAARSASLAPTADGGVLGRARAIYDPSTRRAVIVFDGLRSPQGKVFELWSIANSGPTSLGLIQTDSFGRAIVHIDDAGDPNELNSFAVSIEGPGGSANRHVPGPVVMLGRIEG